MVLRKHLPTLTAALVLGLGGAAGCAAPEPPAKSTTAKGPSIDPNADPLPPQIVPADGRLALDTEYYLGSEAEERASFAEFARQIQELQDRAAADRSQPIQRGFHAKSHGCLDGTLELDPHRDPRTRYGVFADDSITRHVIVRFSNGVGWKQGDSELDARGMAMVFTGIRHFRH